MSDALGLALPNFAGPATAFDDEDNYSGVRQALVHIPRYFATLLDFPFSGGLPGGRQDKSVVVLLGMEEKN